MVARLEEGVKVQEHDLGDVALDVVVAAARRQAIGAAGADDGVVGAVALDLVRELRADHAGHVAGAEQGQGRIAADGLGAAVLAHVQVDAAARIAQVVERFGAGRGSDRIVAELAAGEEDGVVAAAAREGIVAASEGDLIVAAVARDRGVKRRLGQRIGLQRADDGAEVRRVVQGERQRRAGADGLGGGARQIHLDVAQELPEVQRIAGRRGQRVKPVIAGHLAGKLERVVAGARDQAVVARAGHQRGVAAAGHQCIVAAIADQRIVRRVAGDRIGERCADHAFKQPDQGQRDIGRALVRRHLLRRRRRVAGRGAAQVDDDAVLELRQIDGVDTLGLAVDKVLILADREQVVQHHVDGVLRRAGDDIGVVAILAEQGAAAHADGGQRVVARAAKERDARAAAGRQ